MTIAAITSALPSLPDLPSLTGAPAPGTATAATGVTATGAATGTSGFTTALGNAVDALQGIQNTASADEAKAAAGQGSLTNTMIAASEASLSTQVATAVIDKALTAYTTIANMSF